MQFLLYGAYGYTGRIIAELAAQYQLQPILAGRNGQKLEALSQASGFPFEVLDLQDTKALEQALSKVPLVIHAAGPFIHTCQAMMAACLKTRTHYIDITGEIGVFERLQRLDQEAKAAGIMVLPGAGFDVVPTDCLANALHQRLPESAQLQLAFWGLSGGLSHGTAMTMVDNLGKGSWVRKDGRLRPTALGHKTVWVDHKGKNLLAMTIPWGDISTAYFSTGIPNIETYMGVHPRRYRQTRYLPYINWLLRMPVVRQFVKRRFDQQPAGPSPEQRAQARSLIWGQVIHPDGRFLQGKLESLDGYTLTGHTSLMVAKKVLAGQFTPGYQTPATAYGPEFILEVPETSWSIGEINEDFRASSSRHGHLQLKVLDPGQQPSFQQVGVFEAGLLQPLQNRDTPFAAPAI